MPLSRFPFRTFLLAASAALTLGACQPDAETVAAKGELTVPALQFTERTLANGLRVYAMPDQSTANVTVHVWYDVGSKDDPPARSGFAHLFEHIMFKATRNMPAETLDRLTEDAGGYNNASTWNDFTNYYETVPANHLERVLWAEAERMGSLVVDDAIFRSERDVVKEEYRQRILAQPYGKLFGLYLNQASFQVHPYGRPGIGSIADLDAATVEDVRGFHAAYYRPDNAVLVVAGRFDPAQLDAMVDKYFAPIPTPAREIPRVAAVEPERTAAQDFTVYEPNVPLPAVVISWPDLPATHPDIAAWSIADAILSRGQSSRLYKSLVYEQQIAAEAGSQIEGSKDPGLASVYAILSDGKSAEDGLTALRAEVARMRDELVTAAELEEAKNELVTETLDGRETSDGRAFELAYSVIMYGDPKASDDLLAKLQAVTAEDVQRVARAVMVDERAITIRYLPEETRNGAAEATFTDAPTIQATALSIPTPEITVFTLAPEGERVAPPSVGAPVTVAVPGASEKTLPNGLRVIVAQKPGLPLISASLRIGAGGAADPANRAGLASMTADIASRGTATRSATAIAAEIESLGAGLGSGAGSDATDVSIGGRSDKADAMFAVMADVAMNPAFAPEEIDRARQETLDGLLLGLRNPATVANIAMTRALFGDAPYGGVASPTSVQAITQDDMKALHAATWRPDNAVLVISGDVTPDQGFALAERTFGAWVKPETALPAAPNAAAGAPEPRYIVVDMPQMGQAAVLMGLRGISRTDADYFPLLVANDVLGGGYSARLNNEIRIKRGLSYGARAGMSARQAPGSLIASAQTRNDAVPQVVDLMSSELARLGAEPMPQAELDARKAVLIGGFGRSIETTAGLAGQLSALAQYGLPLDKLSTYAADVAAVTVESAGSAARKYFNPSMADIVVAGDAAVFWRELTANRANFERINIEELNLDSATLK